MLKQVDITNLQVHKHLTLDFHSGFNVIVGESDVGKTAIRRAIEWCAFNRPLAPDAWTHHGESLLDVKLTLDDGSVERLKDKSRNIYILDGDAGHPFASIGTDVPEAVRRRLNLHPINIQRQHGVPFLVSETGGAVARYINEMVNLEVMDRSLANAAAAKRQNEQDIRAKEQEAARLQEDLDGFPDLGSAEAFIEGLEETAARISGLQGRHRAVEGLLGRLREAETAVSGATLPPTLVTRVAALHGVSERLDAVSFTMDGLTALLERLRQAEGQITDLWRYAEPGLLARMDGLREIRGRLDSVSLRGDRLGAFLGRLRDLDGDIIQADGDIVAGQRELKEKFPRICPLCGRG